ncbi:MAG: fumarylacetoacetate hydrolase family protein [Pseudomonadota bacterium]
MRLITFTKDGYTRTGALRGDGVVDLPATDAEIPADMIALLGGGDAMLQKAEAASASGDIIADITDVKLESPVPRPPKILAVGVNYKDHFMEIPEETRKKVGGKLPESPIIFNKQPTSATGPFDPVFRPVESDELDYEAELGVVIGKTCRRVSRERAFDVIAGYTVVNDVTVRDWQRKGPTMTMGKSWDSHCPMGPALVTKNEVPDPQNLEVILTVDGVERQHFNTKDMVFNIAEQIEFLSTAFTLLPGDVIVTGTSAGVATFAPGQPYLREGQSCRVAIEALGHIENPIALDEGTSFVH